MKRIIFLAVLFLSFKGIAQKPISIHGKILKEDKSPVQGAIVELLNPDSSLIKIEISNKEGLFEFKNVVPARYVIKTNFIGFSSRYDKVVITENATDKILEPFVLNATAGSLSNVEVVSKKPFIETRIDKTVINVDASPTSAGLNALELIEKSPGASVDQDGNISLKGKAGVLVLIDGKISHLQGQDLANLLKSYNSSQIDQLEIMTQPPAKYDASGNSGVINIKTKKSKSNGFNATVTTNIAFARYFKNAHGISMNLRQNKINVFANYNYYNWSGYNDLNIERSYRENKKSPVEQYYSQHNYGIYKARPHMFKAGLDFYVNKKTTLGVVGNGYINKADQNSESEATIYDGNKNVVLYNKANLNNKDPWSNYGLNLNLRHVINKSSEISADADYVNYQFNRKQSLNNFLYNPDGSIYNPSNPDDGENPYFLSGNIPSDINIYSLKTDYSKTLKDEGKIEAGMKFSYVKNDNNALYLFYKKSEDKWKDDPRSNHFKYNEAISAAYVSYRKQIKKFGLQLGLRAEQTIAKGNQVKSNTTFTREYFEIFPTVYFSYNASDVNTWTLSYGRRIERPNYQDMNPYQEMIDKFTYKMGNPLLKPQFSNNIQLGYNYKNTLTASVEYSVTNDIIDDVLVTKKNPDNTSTAFQTKDNIAKRRSVNLSIGYNKSILKWWMLMVNTMLFNNDFEGKIQNESIKTNLTTFNANINNQFNFGKGFSGELSGFYNSESLIGGNLIAQPMGSFSIGLKKQFLNNRASIGINYRDPFKLQKFSGRSEMEKFILFINNEWENRRCVVSFSYRFGKSLQQQNRKTGSATDEQNRVKSNSL